MILATGSSGSRRTGEEESGLEPKPEPELVRKEPRRSYDELVKREPPRRSYDMQKDLSELLQVFSPATVLPEPEEEEKEEEEK